MSKALRKTSPLGQKHRTHNDPRLLVSIEDKYLLEGKPWNIVLNKYGTSYAFKEINKVRWRMHRLIMRPSPGQIVDHINGDGLDNRRENLRLCNNTQNMQNARKKKGTISRYKGVRFCRRVKEKQWRAGITVHGKNIYLGYYLTQEGAALAYNLAAEKHFGEFAKLNDVNPQSLRTI